MSAIRDIAIAVSSAGDGSPALKYNRGANSRGDGDRYEERVLALVFLRCLRRGLIFQLSANNGDAGKFDDVVLVWRPEGHPEAHILCVQLKHKKSAIIQRPALLSKAPNCDFGLSKYCTSYAKVIQSLEMYTVKFVLMTNARLGANCHDLFETQDTGSDRGLELLHGRGVLSRLNPNNQEVCEIVSGATSFLEHFYLLWKENDCDQIDIYICKELEVLLGAGDVCKFICDTLCKRVREWMNSRKAVCLTRSWDKWQVLVDEYIEKEVTKSRVVTTRLKYCSVADVWKYVDSHNLAWVRPCQRGMEALSATKIHQALTDQTHIMVTLKHFREMQQRILRCWGPFCQYLVVVDDYSEDICDILNKLKKQTENGRRLVIVSSRENNNSFIDTCESSEISDDSWEELLDVNVRLNGARYKCQLRDLVAGVDDLKKLLDGRPALLLALARLSQPLRMGQELETLPEYYVPRKLADRWLVKDEFFSSLGFRDVCVTNTASYEPLKREIGKHSVMRLAVTRSCFPKRFQVEWPLVVLYDKPETIKVECKGWGGLNIFLLQRSAERWRILRLTGVRNRIWGYRTEEDIHELEALDTARNVVIVEGRPQVGKSKMLSHVAEQIKERDSICWLLRVNLSKFYSALDNSNSVKKAVADILKAMVFNKDQLGRLEYALLVHNMIHSPKVVFLVDGFDEVCPDYAGKCLEVLSLLAQYKGKLVVTTRPAVVRLLEARMGVLAYSLKPFSKSELEDFFRQHPFAGNIPPINRLNMGLRNFLRLPMYAEMFVKLSQEKADTNDIVTLYEAFFQNIFGLFYEEKRGDNVSAPGKKREVEEAKDHYEQQLMLLAASHLLRNKVKLAKPKLDTEYFVKYGIVYKLDNGKPAFLHWSFAEHFLAKWCFLRAGEKIRSVMYQEAYVEKRMTFFLESFDRRAVKGRPLLEAVLDGDEHKVQQLLARGSNPRETDACGRNALHLAAAYDTRRTSSVLQLLCKSPQVGTLSEKDNLLGWTPLRYAAEGRSWAAVNVMLELGGDIGQLGSFPVRRQDPRLLQTEFERGGYWALWQYVLSVDHPSRKAKTPWQGVCIQIQFAVSLLSTNMSTRWLRDVAERAKKEGHHAVSSIILYKLTRRGENVNSFCGRKN